MVTMLPAAPAGTEALDPIVHQVLDISTVTEDRIILPTQLDRNLYESVNEVIRRLGGKWKGGKTRAHLFPHTDPRPLIETVLSSRLMPPDNPFDFYPTPKPLVDDILKYFADDLKCAYDGTKVLEPSAGMGSLAEAMERFYDEEYPIEVQIDCCEIQPINRAILKKKGFNLVAEDFLQYDPTNVPEEEKYKVILMNPPFKYYVEHIEHAWKWLRHGGALIAIGPLGFTFADKKHNGKLYDFCTFVLKHGGYLENPKDAFKESGTMSSTVTMGLIKEDQSWRREKHNGYASWYAWNACLLAECNYETYERFVNRMWREFNQKHIPPRINNPKLRAYTKTFFEQVIADERKEGRYLELNDEDYADIERHYIDQWMSDEGIEGNPEVEPAITLPAPAPAPAPKKKAGPAKAPKRKETIMLPTSKPIAKPSTPVASPSKKEEKVKEDVEQLSLFAMV